MKLFTKYNRINIAATIIVLMIGGLFYYFILHFILIKQLDKDLKVEEQEIMDYIKENNSLPEATNNKDQKITFQPTDSAVKRNFRSVDFLNVKENEIEATRQLIFPINIAAKNYRANVSKSQQETEDLVKLIVLLTLAIVVLLLMVLFIINRFVLNKLWLPFNTTLAELKKFNLSNKTAVNLENTTINEFKELNYAVAEMSNSVLKDYEGLKSFTENASHEIQTPLAVIHSKLELLMQSENFTEQQMQYIQHIQGETSRLSKLNQSLLLLTKIDNHQFKHTEEVELAKIISKQLDNFEELIAAKEISLTKNIATGNIVLMNETMAEVMVANLITNAIKHNIKNGAIAINLDKNQLKVSNTGPVLQSDPAELFERFKKDSVAAESLGLGLSIVKKITEQYGFTVLYNYADKRHTVTINF